MLVERWVTMQDSVPRRRSSRMCLAATIEEIEFEEKFARECAFITTLSAITPSSTRWGDRVEEDLLSPISRDNWEIMSRGPQVLDMEHREQD